MNTIRIFTNRFVKVDELAGMLKSTDCIFSPDTFLGNRKQDYEEFVLYSDNPDLKEQNFTGYDFVNRVVLA